MCAPLWFLDKLEEAFQRNIQAEDRRRLRADTTQEEVENDPSRSILFMSDRVLNSATIYFSQQEMIQ
jgi:hypothetical protein